jgi:hypothetical protein
VLGYLLSSRKAGLHFSASYKRCNPSILNSRSFDSALARPVKEAGRNILGERSAQDDTGFKKAQLRHV